MKCLLASVFVSILLFSACTLTESDPIAELVDGDAESAEQETGCIADSYSCRTQTEIRHCRLDGSGWEFYRVCYTGEICQAGECVRPIPSDGDTPDGDQDAPDGDAETDGEGVATCTAGAYSCADGRSVQRCAPDGETWALFKACRDDESCVDGSCVFAGPDEARCTPYARRCLADRLWQCGPSGDGFELMDWCMGDLACEDGACIHAAGDACDTGVGCVSDSEYCFAREGDGTSGVCVPYCDTGEGRCPRGYRCEHGTCVAWPGYCRSDMDCAMDAYCKRFEHSTDGLCQTYCMVPGESCGFNEICNEDETSPTYGRCVVKDPSCEICDGTTYCGDDRFCDFIPGDPYGCCREACNHDDDCPGLLVCTSDGRCVMAESACDPACPAGYVCDENIGQCVLNCPACPEGSCCDSSSAPHCYDCRHCENPPYCGYGLPSCCWGYECSAIVYGVLGYCI